RVQDVSVLAIDVADRPADRWLARHAGADRRRAVELAVGRAEHVLHARADAPTVRPALGGIAAVARVVHALARSRARNSRDAAAGNPVRDALARVAVRPGGALHRRAWISRRRVARAGRTAVRVRDVPVLAIDGAHRAAGDRHAGADRRRAVELAVGRAEHVLHARADSRAIGATGRRIARVVRVVRALPLAGAGDSGEAAARHDALARLAAHPRTAVGVATGVGVAVGDAVALVELRRRPGLGRELDQRVRRRHQLVDQAGLVGGRELRDGDQAGSVAQQRQEARLVPAGRLGAGGVEHHPLARE